MPGREGLKCLYNFGFNRGSQLQKITNVPSLNRQLQTRLFVRRFCVSKTPAHITSLHNSLNLYPCHLRLPACLQTGLLFQITPYTACLEYPISLSNVCRIPLLPVLNIPVISLPQPIQPLNRPLHLASGLRRPPMFPHKCQTGPGRDRLRAGRYGRSMSRAPIDQSKLPRRSTRLDDV